MKLFILFSLSSKIRSSVKYWMASVIAVILIDFSGNFWTQQLKEFLCSVLSWIYIFTRKPRKYDL